MKKIINSQKLSFLKNLYRYEKIRFLIYGSINFLLTNIILQFLLIITKIQIATFISQFFNLVIGFYFYKNKVFRLKVFKKITIIGYILLALTTWQINWRLIFFINNILKISSNISAILVIPILAFWSYAIQKNFIFKIYK